MKRGILIIALVAAPVFADEVHLRGGGKISGVIVEETEDSVTVDIGGGKLTTRMSSVVKIERKGSPLQEYRERAAKVAPGDAEGWRQLARWATGVVLSTQVSEAWLQVVAIIPNDAEANAALGKVLLDGVWVSEEESFRARGFVKFEGEWMLPNERQAILQDRQAQEAADRQAMQAQSAAEDEAYREREAAKQAQHDEFWRDNLPQVGDPIGWGWGYGPTYWPTVPAGDPLLNRPGTLPAGGRR